MERDLDGNAKWVSADSYLSSEEKAEHPTANGTLEEFYNKGLITDSELSILLRAEFDSIEYFFLESHDVSESPTPEQGAQRKIGRKDAARAQYHGGYNE